MVGLLSIPAVLVAIGTILGGAIVGFFYFNGIFSRAKAVNIKEAKDASEFIITTLEKKIDVLELKINEATVSLIDMNKRLDGLQSENKLLRDIFQGRDDQTQRFQEAGFKAMEQTGKVVANIVNIEERVNKILDIIEHRQVVVTKIHKDIQSVLDKNKD